VKQYAAELARELLKKKTPELTPEGFQVDGGKIVGIERRALEALEDQARLYTGTVGLSLEQIANDLKTPEVADEDVPTEYQERLREERKRSEVWTLPLSKLPGDVFPRIAGPRLVSDPNEARLGKVLVRLRQESLAAGKSGHVTITAFAKELDVSRDTLYCRRRPWLEFYRKWNREKEHLRLADEKDIDPVRDLRAQGVCVTRTPERESRPDRMPADYAKVAQPHLAVVEACERKQCSVADLKGYLKHLPLDELWSLTRELKDRGYSDDMLSAIGFSGRQVGCTSASTPKDSSCTDIM